MKSIAIIGGGISGLAALHYLKQRCGEDVSVDLYERNAFVGGNIQTVAENGFLFEKGPNGFLTNQPNTLAFIEELGLSNQLVTAQSHAKRRYIEYQGRLIAFPLDPLSFIQFSPFSVMDRVRLMTEWMKGKGENSQESVFDFVSRRCGVGTANYLIDPFVTGVFAGDVKRLHMASAFPKMVKLENEHGSLIKGMFKGEKKAKAQMTSFTGGMSDLVNALAHRYADSIHCNTTLKSMDDIPADYKIIATPAYVTSQILTDASSVLREALESIVYVPVMVVGLGFKRSAFKKQPDGFGYLIPSNQGKEVLGVLIESNVYANRAPADHVMIRMMIGGRHHPAIVNDTPQQLLQKALKQLDHSYGLTEDPVFTSIAQWSKAIPQYEMNYPSLYQTIHREMKTLPNVRLVGNYLDGISFNESILNAKQVAESLSL